MADFLTRAAQRALGAAPVVKPVIPSRYAGTGVTTGFAEEAVEAVEAVAPRPPARAETEPAVRVPRDEPRRIEEPARTAREEAPAAPRTEPIPQMPAQQAVRQQPAGRNPEPEHAEAPAEPPARPPLEQRGPVTPEVRIAGETTAVREELGTTGVAEAGRLQPPITRRQVREAIAEPAAQPIRITIGRIEVRAVMPAAAPPPRNGTAGRPALTLEEYTRRRKRGER